MVDSQPAAGNLGVEGCNPQLKLLDRKRIEILADKFGQRIVGLAGEKIVQVHGEQR